MSNEINMIAELLKQNPELTGKLKEVIAEIDAENKTPKPEDFARPTAKRSYYIVHFDIDQRDADCISVSTREIYGKMDIEELTKLTILANYMLLDDYDGEWYNLGPLEDYLKEYLDGFFYDPCNRFKVDDINITGYDADKNEFFEIDMPDLLELGIKDINEAYHKYFGVEDEYEDDDE